MASVWRAVAVCRRLFSGNLLEEYISFKQNGIYDIGLWFHVYNWHFCKVGITTTTQRYRKKLHGQLSQIEGVSQQRLCR
jgi:hypothetical protein